MIFSGATPVFLVMIFSIWARFASVISTFPTTTSAFPSLKFTTVSLNPFDASIVSAADSFSAVSVISSIC